MIGSIPTGVGEPHMQLEHAKLRKVYPHGRGGAYNPNLRIVL